MNLTEQPPINFYHYLKGDGTTLAAHMSLSSVGAEQLRILLSRALNTLPPHDPQWKDWFELSDALDKAASAQPAKQKLVIKHYCGKPLGYQNPPCSEQYGQCTECKLLDAAGNSATAG